MEPFHEESGYYILKSPLKYPKLKPDAVPVYVQDYLQPTLPQARETPEDKRNEIRSYSFDSDQPPLSQSYAGPHLVLKRSDKVFTILVEMKDRKFADSTLFIESERMESMAF
ncbi:hypothetical protein HNY73_006234 [Argiope bruennichi]|uniref:Uncharacterized protein n=1 Tax=Argiope bruennichi TaxID=94029 RepID=A0A8T0FK25_ARGBR|nr:hypothetical protein HNY73_006234 [Argiope bruennichi]